MVKQSKHVRVSKNGLPFEAGRKKQKEILRTVVFLDEQEFQDYNADGTIAMSNLDSYLIPEKMIPDEHDSNKIRELENLIYFNLDKALKLGIRQGPNIKVKFDAESAEIINRKEGIIYLYPEI